MAGRLTEATERELEELIRRYGEPVRTHTHIENSFFDPLERPDRFGEVCMVVRRPNGKLLVTTKDFYPAGAFRLPTGGISHGESVLAALLREAHEETGLTVEVRRFLAWVGYLDDAGKVDLFHTFAFLLDEKGGTLGSLDPHERIAAYAEVSPEELDRIGDLLASTGSEQSADIGGDWRDWGRFRATVHYAVAEALT